MIDRTYLTWNLAFGGKMVKGGHLTGSIYKVLKSIYCREPRKMVAMFVPEAEKCSEIHLEARKMPG